MFERLFEQRLCCSGKQDVDFIPERLEDNEILLPDPRRIEQVLIFKFLILTRTASSVGR